MLPLTSPVAGTAFLLMNPQNNVVLISLRQASFRPFPKDLGLPDVLLSTLPPIPGNTARSSQARVPLAALPDLPQAFPARVPQPRPHKSWEPRSFQRPPSGLLTRSSSHAPPWSKKPRPPQVPVLLPSRVPQSGPSQVPVISPAPNLTDPSGAALHRSPSPPLANLEAGIIAGSSSLAPYRPTAPPLTGLPKSSV